MGLLFTSTSNKTTAALIIVNGHYCPTVNGHAMGRQTQQWTLQKRHCSPLVSGLHQLQRDAQRCIGFLKLKGKNIE